MLHLIEPDGGSVLIDGQRLHRRAGSGERRKLRRRLQIVFQDALSSLNPRMTVGVNIAEPMRLQGLGHRRPSAATAARELLQLVGLRAAGRRTAIRTSSPAASASASRLRAR